MNSAMDTEADIEGGVSAPSRVSRRVPMTPVRGSPARGAAPGDPDASRAAALAAERAANARARAVTDRPVPGSVRREPVLPVRAPRLAPATRWVIGAFGALLVASAALVALNLMRDPVRFPVTNVDVIGTLDYVDRDALRTVVGRFTGAGFYGLDIDGLRVAVEALPWVAQARIGREWPGRLEVGVDEHEPAARWNDDALVSKRLELFRPPQLQPDDPQYADWQRVFADLPVLVGNDGRHQAVLEDFRRYELDLKALGLGVERLEEDARGSQTLALTGGIGVRLGQQSREERFARFVDVWPRLADSVARDPASFDMRYANGFALGGTRAARVAPGNTPTGIGIGNGTSQEGPSGNGREG